MVQVLFCLLQPFATWVTRSERSECQKPRSNDALAAIELVANESDMLSYRVFKSETAGVFEVDEVVVGCALASGSLPPVDCPPMEAFNRGCRVGGGCPWLMLCFFCVCGR